MENKTANKKEKKTSQAAVYLKKTGNFVSRWLYLAALLGAALFAVSVWHKYIVKSEWSEEKKKEYISQQAVFSFDRENYQKAADLLNNRKESLEKEEKFSGRDIFFPEGF